jgi:hypothetical protein
MKATTIIMITLLFINTTFCHAEDRYEAGNLSQNATTGDFNNDGYIDFCVNNHDDNTISVFFNYGNGKFTLHDTYATFDYPLHITVADLNNDGFHDMMLPFNGPNLIYIFFNKGNGTFKEPYVYNFDGNLCDYPLVAADMNNDGYLDILITGLDSPLLFIMFNKGDGTFYDPLKLSSTIEADSIPFTADIDNDGFLDVFVLSIKSYGETQGIINFFRNKGDGTFYDQISYEIPSHYSTITFADVNNDGYLDILCNNPLVNSISVLYNKKDGSFEEPVIYQSGTLPMPITTADVNKDGWIDLLVTNMDSQNIGIYLNKGDGTFKNPITYPTGNKPRQVVTSDLNNDGWTDMIVSCQSSRISKPPTNDIWVYLNNGDGSFNEGVRYGRGKQFYEKPEIVDIDNDGWLDMIQSDEGYLGGIKGKVSVFRNIGKGKFDNSGIDLRTDPYKATNMTVMSGNDVKIIVDFRTFPKSTNLDLYFVMMGPDGTIYSGLAWNEGIFPALRDLTLPANTNLFDLTLCEFTIPSQKPPVSALGTYTFALGAFKPGTMESLSNIAITSFNVIGQ